jgi:hypothetical protein
MSTAVRRAIYGKLSGDTTLSGMLGTPATGYAKGIYYQEAPAGAGFPFIIMNKQSGVPTETLTDPSALEADVWMIKAVDRATSADTAEAVQARVQALLNDAVLSIAGADHLYLRRESDLDYGEVANGVTYRHAGSLYRLIYDPA